MEYMKRQLAFAHLGLYIMTYIYRMKQGLRVVLSHLSIVLWSISTNRSKANIMSQVGTSVIDVERNIRIAQHIFPLIELKMSSAATNNTAQNYGRCLMYIHINKLSHSFRLTLKIAKNIASLYDFNKPQKVVKPKSNGNGGCSQNKLRKYKDVNIQIPGLKGANREC